MNLTATIVDFTSGDSSRKRAAPEAGGPGEGERHHRLPGLPAHRGQPDLSRCACEVATGGSNAPTYVHGASSGIRSEFPKGFAFTCFVVAVPAGGDGFPAKVNVGGN